VVEVSRARHMWGRVEGASAVVFGDVAKEVGQLKRNAQRAGAQQRSAEVARRGRAVNVSQKVADHDGAAVNVGLDQVVERLELARPNGQSYGVEKRAVVFVRDAGFGDYVRYSADETRRA